MKNFFILIVAAIIAVMLYLPCRDLAVRERKTSEGIGGEILLPFGTMLGACLYICEERSETE